MVRSRRGRAFSFLEILAVVAILAVLAAVLYPIVGSARRSAGRAACLSNERQIAAAMLLYTADPQDTFPFGSTQPGTGWALAIQSSLRSVAALRCPEDPTDAGNAGPYRFVNSYAMNANLGGATFRRKPAGVQETPAMTETVLHDPARSAMFFEVSDNVTAFAWTVPRKSGPPDFDGTSPSGDTTTRPGLAVSGSESTFLLGSGGQYDYAPGVRVTRYATGDVGGRKLNGALGSVPRHSGRANYLACDGHLQVLVHERVSGCSDALGETCDQGTQARQSGACAAQSSLSAAGTGNGRYALTFSTR